MRWKTMELQNHYFAVITVTAPGAGLRWKIVGEQGSHRAAE